MWYVISCYKPLKEWDYCLLDIELFSQPRAREPYELKLLLLLYSLSMIEIMFSEKPICSLSLKGLVAL